MISAGGVSANQMAFGCNPADSFGWGGNDEDMLFSQDKSLTGQFVQQWKVCLRAGLAALKEVANSELRRLLAYDASIYCAESAVGDSVFFLEDAEPK